ncbi:UDP-N-acetylglucosamine--N-acetylmuramyl-(pentapeptide) pyrophosphoryl-undecaprenol N-acetylglucosamine transferase MurG [Botrimarina colliarenosi]|uniref:UDP-N-acetylglucosamine--N-acetylmuramyl-(Pentapeptide) pyrophosphoryl-undecaprenol N-acetylglucosamine transferase MurG n=1 Tax=Botrimarina colliarenosi TaxID=2528001 RepID=A0A5C6A8M9_9BACT|nr:UDP-N-acetylglucosamine--N-acetylmuramyl-(pentapeptide) pyrophosphoryl-undecaprenol N-acetylglucosamine transferase [Botrimarina colliarenosi]TWT95816.1 UDP-N-acetylglucosamine--N-acetylmuramyl-(pentapeptide) pyrophosphoryl-undecaprenol N-acetylglucosamine transferase MurG [Botrimarina colliarenosi]
MAKAPHILIAGGGSLESIYPGLSVARQLLWRMPRARVTIAGDGRAIERHTVRGVGLRYATVPRSRFPVSVLDAPGYVARNAAGWCVAHWLLREQEIDLVISVGGHAAGPTVRAARTSGIPYILLEQNSLPYPPTRDAASAAAAVCLAHEETAARLPIDSPVRLTGPVGRPGFEDDFGVDPGLRQPPIYDSGRPRLLVLGGVGGATSLNLSMPAAMKRLGDAAAGWQVVHQAGDGWLTATEKLYSEAGVDALVVSHIDELAHLARATDLVVCRPGGSTLAELSLAGLPAVLVPDSRRRDGLHEANARLASMRTGCPIVSEPDGDLAVSLAAGLCPLLSEPALREGIAQRMRQAARPEASALVADAVAESLAFETAPLVRRAA